ncbi:MAG: crotonase/enoyl-CoA hydratase family protein [Pseudomonadota bacterium]
MDAVTTEQDGPVWIVTINRPEKRNAVDGLTALALAEAFRTFDRDPNLCSAVLTGAGGHFCAGADLKAAAAGEGSNHLQASGDGPMGPSRMVLSKPVIAAIEGHAVAGGLELAAWCDLRVADPEAVFGVFCRRWGVPLVDGGTLRLPRLIGQSRAMDMILTGRPVGAEEALRMGLVNRLSRPACALAEAIDLAKEIASFPQLCMRADRASAIAQWGLSETQALQAEFAGGEAVIKSGETQAGAKRFAGGLGRHGDFEKI